MSVIIPISSLTIEQQQAIINHAVVKSKESFHDIKMKWKNPRYQPRRKILNFYKIENDNVYLPYAFANCLLQRCINLERNYPELQFQFNGQLLENQTSIVNEALQHLTTLGTTTLAVYPGCGKTVMASYLSSILKGLTLVVVTMRNLLGQWKETFNQLTTAGVWVVGEKIPDNDINIIISMDGQIDKIPVEIIPMISILIIDECHLFCTPSSLPSLLFCQPRYIVALSATPERADGMDTIIKLLCGYHQVKRTIPKFINVYQLNTNVDYTIKLTTNGDSDWKSYVDDIIDNEFTNNLIIHLTQKCKRHKILIMTPRIKHAEQLYNKLKECGEQVDYMYGNKEKYEDSRILVGGTTKVGVGFDDKRATGDTWNGCRINLLIWCITLKDAAAIEQIIGRVCRSDNPQVIVLTNNCHISQNHWKKIKRYINKDNKGKCNELQLSTVLNTNDFIPYFE